MSCSGAFSPVAFSSTAVVLALLAACTQNLSVLRVYDPHCADLGNLTLSSHDEAAAISAMQQQVLERGGDSLLYGEDAVLQLQIVRSERIVETANAMRKEAVERGEPVAPIGPIIDAMSAGRQAPAGESWYYGAALRCS